MGQDRSVETRATDPAETAGPPPFRRYLGAAALFLASAGLLWWMVAPNNAYSDAPIAGSFMWWLLLAAAVRVLRHVPPRRIGAVVVGGTLLLGLAGLSAPPRTSNDSARYSWDGIVQKAGISPYAYVPIDETLDHLRPAWLFAPGTTGATGEPVCAPGLFGTESVAARGYPSQDPLCTAINRPYVHTIYPPTAEIYFLGVRAAVPDAVGFLSFQLAGLLVSAGVTAVLVRVLRRSGKPAYLAAVWGWSPLVQLEAVNNAHVDVLGGALILAAGLLLLDGKPLRSGAAFGAAVATKLIPVIAAPALLFRRPARFIAASVATFVLLYIPYVLGAGVGVIGFLPGYLKEEGYSGNGGVRFGLAQLVSTGPWPAILSAVVLTAVAFTVLRRTTPENAWAQQTVMIGLTLLIVSPTYPWYSLMLLPFVVLSGRWEYIAVILALDVNYLTPSLGLPADTVRLGGLLAAALAVGAGTWLRHRKELATAALSGLDTAPLQGTRDGA